MLGLSVVTKTLQIIASIGVAKVVTTVVDNAVKGAGVGAFTRAAHWTGSIVLGSMAVEQATQHIARLVDTGAEEFEELKKKAEEAQAKKTEDEK